MKANEAPEKIWVRQDTFLIPWSSCMDENANYGGIEYIRTDVFIEKAIGWIDYNNRDGGCYFDGWEKDFRNYMKGE